MTEVEGGDISGPELRTCSKFNGKPLKISVQD